MESISDLPNQTLTLFDRFGGRAFLNVAAEKLSDRLLADPKISEIVRPIGPTRLCENVVYFATRILIGNDALASVTNHIESLSDELRPTQLQFDRVISHIIAALVWTGIDRPLIEEILNRVTPLSNQLVRPAESGEKSTS